MNFLKNILKSIFIGAGSIAPGVSGGALAIVMGLYEKIIYAINNFFKDIKKNGIFLLSIGIGAAIGVVGFSSIQLTLIKKFEMQTMFTFAGLVVGTLPILIKTANKKGFSYKLLFPFLITLVLGFILTYINKTSISENVENVEVLFNFRNVLFLLLVGFIMAGSLVIPGISGTVLLFLLGVYGLVLNAVASVTDILDLPLGSKEMFSELFSKMFILIPLGLGLLIGTLVFSKLMEYLLEHKYSMTYYAIIGFVIGSIPELLPKFEFVFNKKEISSLIFFFIAVLCSLQINKLVKD